MRLKIGAATEPPSCSPTGESIDTRIVTAGLLMGAKPVNEATKLLGEYRPVVGSIFCADPVLPAAVHPSRRANVPVPPANTTPSIIRRSVAAVSGRITRRGSTGVSGPVAGNTFDPL